MDRYRKNGNHKKLRKTRHVPNKPTNVGDPNHKR